MDYSESQVLTSGVGSVIIWGMAVKEVTLESLDGPFVVQVGQLVYDDLTRKKVKVLKIKQTLNKTVGIWVDSTWFGGGRHPWEISKI